MTDPLIHPHETLTSRDGERAEIDTEMVPVIRELWRLDFTTLACCQDVGEATAVIRARSESPSATAPTASSPTTVVGPCSNSPSWTPYASSPCSPKSPCSPTGSVAGGVPAPGV